MSDHSEEPNLRFHPDALNDIPEEARGAVIAAFAQVLVPGGLEALVLQSYSIEAMPADGNCPACGTPLTVDPEWDDERLCPKDGCENAMVRYIAMSEEFYQTAMERLAEVQAGDDDTLPDGEGSGR